MIPLSRSSSCYFEEMAEKEKQERGVSNSLKVELQARDYVDEETSDGKSRKWLDLTLGGSNSLTTGNSSDSHGKPSPLKSLRVQPHSVVNKPNREGVMPISARCQDFTMTYTHFAFEEATNMAWPGSFHKSKFSKSPPELQKLDLNLKL
ncbi:hypothetical protein M5K25_019608 [Dendrobium thyrsiflorum]|uniref:Auxin-responsive protein n=1 Tax=Dendrobium thyrsiflorum TaxID=117978 RepID=A0ABD0UF76_DENTH